MLYNQVVTETAASATSITATITASAGSCLAFALGVGGADVRVSLSSAGWYDDDGFFDANFEFSDAGPRIEMYCKWRTAITAGDYTVTATFTDPTDTEPPYASKACESATLHLVEIANADGLTDWDASSNDNSTKVPPDSDPNDLAISNAREGNIALFFVAWSHGADTIAPPVGGNGVTYTTIAETEGSTADGDWTLGAYYNALPYATLYAAQATGTTASGYVARHFNFYETITQSALLGVEL